MSESDMDFKPMLDNLRHEILMAQYKPQKVICGLQKQMHILCGIVLQMQQEELI
jgi:hypothetical protein